MPPKTRKGKSAPKAEDPPAKQQKDEEKMPTRTTRNRSAANHDPAPTKKHKKED